MPQRVGLHGDRVHVHRRRRPATGGTVERLRVDHPADAPDSRRTRHGPARHRLHVEVLVHRRRRLRERRPRLGHPGGTVEGRHCCLRPALRHLLSPVAPHVRPADPRLGRYPGSSTARLATMAGIPNPDPDRQPRDAIGAPAPHRVLSNTPPRRRTQLKCWLDGGPPALTGGRPAHAPRPDPPMDRRQSSVGSSATLSRTCVCGSASSWDRVNDPVVTPTTKPAPAFMPAPRSFGVSPAVRTRRTSLTPVASIARKMRYGAGLEAVTVSLVTSASTVSPTVQPRLVMIEFATAAA